jgi:hypothetical protein
MIGKAIEGVGQTEVQQVDDRLQTMLSTEPQRSIPERPVVAPRFWLTQTPWCAISDDLDAEGGNGAQVVVNMGVMTTLRELVLTIGNSIGKHQGIGALFANGPRKARESVFAGRLFHHPIGNLAEPANRWLRTYPHRGPR